MKRGFLNSKRIKQQPLHEGGSDAPVTVKESAEDPSMLKIPKYPWKEQLEREYMLSGLKKNIQDLSVHDKDHLQTQWVMGVPSIAKNQPNERISYRLFPMWIAHKLEETPGYPQPVPKPRLPNLFHVKPAPGMDLGVFAKHDIKVHELIFAERPLVVYPTATLFSKGSTEVETYKKHVVDLEGSLKQVIKMMTPEDAKAFVTLHNRHKGSGEELFGILRSNMIEVEIIKGEHENEWSKYGAIGKVGSRFNHHCNPGIRVAFDAQSFSIKYIAVRDIKAGDQIFFSYCNSSLPAEERRKQLETYDFSCQYTACVNATPESDKLREELEERIGKLVQGRQAMLADPKFNVRSLDPLLKLEKDVMKEGLDARRCFPYLLRIILDGYVQLTNQKKTEEYAKKLFKTAPPGALSM